MWNRIVAAGCVVAILVVAPFVWGEGHAEKGGADGRHRVVMHLNSGDETVQKGALSNIKHLYQELGGEHVTVELVVHGAGLELLTKKGTKFGEELERLHGLYGVDYTACSNTMKAMNVTRTDLIEQVRRTVPAMVRLMELQEAGWVYIKP
jgi:uncharacterized protein